MALDENSKTFLVYLAALKAEELTHPLEIAEIAALQGDKALTKIWTKYSNYTDIFLFDLIMELLENTDMNENVIELIEGKRQSYEPIYTLSLVELETLKT